MNPLSCYGIRKYTSIVIVFFLLFLLPASAQTNLDRTDSLANIANQFVIRFDVASGNIYMPLKKKIYKARNTKDQFSLHAFQGKDSSPIILYREVFVNGKVKKEAYDTMISVKTPFLREYSEKDSNFVLFTKGKRMLKPKVGSFIRLIFENVPQHTDVFANMEFVDKNMENSSMAEGFLNSYAATLGEGVKKDTSTILTAITEKIESTIKVADTQVLEQKKMIDEAKIAFDTSLKSIYSDIANLINSKSTNTSKTDLSAITRYVEELKVYIDSLDSLLVPNILIRQKLVDLTESLSKTISDAIAAVGPAKALQDAFQSYQAQSTSFINKTLLHVDSMNALHIRMLTEVDKLNVRIRFITDSVYNRRTVYLQPVQVQNSDLSIINITFRNEKKSETDIQREITLKNKFGFKLDFSTGFLGTGLVDSNYKVLRTPNTGSDTSYIVPDSKGSFAIGFALLAHAYFRTGNRLNFAINTGLMLNGSNQTINYLTGISIPMGLEQRFIVSGGLAFGKVKRLVNFYTLNKSYPANELTAASNPITEKWDKNWYLGVSYNLSSLTRGQRTIVIAKP